MLKIKVAFFVRSVFALFFLQYVYGMSPYGMYLFDIEVINSVKKENIFVSSLKIDAEIKELSHQENEQIFFDSRFKVILDVGYGKEETIILGNDAHSYTLKLSRTAGGHHALNRISKGFSTKNHKYMGYNLQYNYSYIVELFDKD